MTGGAKPSTSCYLRNGGIYWTGVFEAVPAGWEYFTGSWKSFTGS
jgi:hypothetical protein